MTPKGLFFHFHLDKIVQKIPGEAAADRTSARNGANQFENERSVKMSQTVAHVTPVLESEAIHEIRIFVAEGVEPQQALAVHTGKLELTSQGLISPYIHRK